MNNFSLGALDDWEPVDLGRPVQFEGVEGEVHRVRFWVLASAPVEVLVVEAGPMRLVGAGDGLLRVSFAAEGPLAVVVRSASDEEPVVVLRRGRDPQVVEESGLPSFTTIEPRGAGPSSEVMRMMHVVRLNSARRERLLRDELARLGEAYQSVRRERVARPLTGVSEAEVAPAAPTGPPE